ncbi:MAG: hypothetical protein N2038_10825 [Geminicoccaceae bacterium]|nr:hypothetical protein [Geminicoccaceae bacterium]
MSAAVRGRPDVEPRAVPLRASPRIRETRGGRAEGRGRPRAGPDPAAPAGPHEPSPVVAVDRRRLRAQGCLDPEGGRSGLGEELRVIKRPLLERALAASAPRRDRVLLVTSALPGEGKTFLAVNLALSIGLELDARVLLIDADPLRAGATTLLGLPRAPGLAEILWPHPIDPGRALIRTDLGGLLVLPPGEPEPRFTELVSARRMQRLVDAVLSADPRLVLVIDSPPLLASSEAQALARLAGQTVFVVAAGATPKRAVDRALALLVERTDVQLVLNRAPEDTASAYEAYAASVAERTKDPRPTGPFLTRAGAAAGWLALFVPTLVPGAREIVPRIELATAVTDNVRLAPEDRARSDIAAAVGIGVRAASERGALRGRLDYVAKQFLYRETKGGDELRHALDAAARATLVEDRLFLDLAAEAGDVFESGSRLRPRSEFAQLDSRARRIAGTVSPVLVAELGGLARGSLRYRYTEVVHRGATDLADARGHGAAALLASPAAGTGAGWTAGFLVDRTDFGPSASVPARRADALLATFDAELPIAPASALLAGFGWSYLSDELLRDGGGGYPFWRLGVRIRAGERTLLRASFGRVFGRPSGEVRLDLGLGPRTELQLAYEEGLRTRFDEIRLALTEPERWRPPREREDPEAAVRARLLEELLPRRPLPVADAPTEIRRGRVRLALERERTLAALSGYLQSARPEGGDESRLEGGIEAAFVRRLDRRHEFEARLGYERLYLAREQRSVDDLSTTLVLRRRLGEGTRIELGYDFLRRFGSRAGDIVANTIFLRAVKEF